MKTDITMHSDQELSLIVMNDETLYRMRKQFLKDRELLKELFEFTDEQLDECLEDIRLDLEEEEAGE